LVDLTARRTLQEKFGTKKMFAVRHMFRPCRVHLQVEQLKFIQITSGMVQRHPQHLLHLITIFLLTMEPFCYGNISVLIVLS